MRACVQVAKIDLRTRTVAALWDTRPCLYPTGMDIDLDNHRLFLGCAVRRWEAPWVGPARSRAALALTRRCARCARAQDAAAPMLAVLDLDAGFQVASVPIGRGNGGVVWDRAARRVYASNGVAGNVAVIQQRPDDVDTYELLEAVTTYVGAARLAYDAEKRVLWTASAQGAYDPQRPADPNSAGVPFFPNFYFPNTIKVVSLKASNDAAGG